MANATRAKGLIIDSLFILQSLRSPNSLANLGDPSHSAYHVCGTYFCDNLCFRHLTPDIFSAGNNGRTWPLLPVAGADSFRAVRFSLTRTRMSGVDNASRPQFILLI